MVWDSFPEIRRELDRVRTELLREVSRPGGRISEGLGDLLTRDSKLLRPAFTILAARIQNGGQAADEHIIKIAAAVEMLHAASLIHDDIIDRADKRRGGDALHVRYGDRTAVLMGDYLFAKCFSLISEYAKPESSVLISATVGNLIESEVSEYVRDPEDSWSVRSYLHRIIGKTAVLFSLSFHLGVIEASPGRADPLLVEILRRIGYNVGVGFQIVDDVLDIFGETEITGKPSGTDLKQGIMTLPVILAANNGQRLELSRVLDRISRSGARRSGAPRLGARRMSLVKLWENRTMDEARLRIENGGGKHGALAAAELYTRRAHRELNRLPKTEERGILQSVTTQLLSRVS